MDEISLSKLPIQIHMGQNSMNGSSFDIHNATVGNSLASTTSYLTHEHSLNENDETFRYISQILMEEDVEDKDCMLQQSLEFQKAEKSLYEAIGKKYPPSPDQRYADSTWNLDCTNLGFSDDGELMSRNLFGFEPVHETPQPTFSSLVNEDISFADGLIESPTSSHEALDLCNHCQFDLLFMKGVNEASKFIPDCDKFSISAQYPPNNSEGRGKKNLNASDEQGRSSKQPAVYSDPNVHSDISDEVLLHHPGDKNKAIACLRETLQTEAMKRTQQIAQSIGKGRAKRENSKKEVVDFRALLISCAEAVAVDNRRVADEFLKKIRNHSSHFGDGNQRLAHCFANALEARLAGTGSQIYKSLVSKRISVSEVLKAHLLYLAACPFQLRSSFFSGKTIGKLTRGASRIHIIDFGILYGFQWPGLIQRLSERANGPPLVRMTGIEFPQPGFRPAERVEETGRRLAHYAREFGVPFEFNAIAKRWETVRIDDLNLSDDDEFVIVNCIGRMKNLPDESLGVDSSRNGVLKMIRSINPSMFVQGVINGSYNAPFFVTRFKEAVFHFSSHFDMLETLIPHENEERMFLERDVLGREVLNVVACEGWERVERPESYRKWDARTLKAGFGPIPLDPEHVDRAKLRMSVYHKDFVIDEDRHWLLLGWKGRILHALSTWKPR